MSTDGKSLPLAEMDTNLMFEQHTVEEIRGIEKRTRADIERKKEDLRTMVGERYRDLIEAADTIADMKNSALNVMSTIGRIEGLCADLRSAQLAPNSGGPARKKQELDNRRKEEARFHEVSAQIKLLLDIPEKVWTFLDGQDFLSASRLYLLAQHINTSLHLHSQGTPNFLYWFPVLNRQWAAISHFKFTILQGCRQLIKEAAVTDQSAIQGVLSSGTESTKELVCSVVHLITTTVHQIYSVFYTPQDDQNDTGLMDLHSSVSSRCLPKSIKEFCPSHKSVTVGVSQSHLHDNCTQWIQTCSCDVQSGVGKLLHFVNTVKHLATIRNTVWDIMAQALIQYQLNATVELTQRQVSKVIIEMDNPHSSPLVSEIDLGSYVWSESPGDIAPHTAWSPAGTRSLVESGGLMMKAKAYTPIVQSFCKNFDEKLKSVSEDYKFYMFLDPEGFIVPLETKPFNRWADSASLLTFIQTSCVASVNRLLLSGRLCAAMCDLTPHLQQSMLGREQIARADGARSVLKKSSSGRLTAGRQEVNSAWEEVKAQLTTVQHSAYRLWIDHLVKITLASFCVAVNSSSPADTIKTCSRWEEVSIEEETEEGRKIMSKIAVPMQASWYLMSALSVLEHLVVSVSDGLVSAYCGVVTQSGPALPQQRALQLLFDVRFLRLIIPRKDDTKESREYVRQLEVVISGLEEQVDPFDLDVFSPYMQANLHKLLTRSAVLLGGLTSLDRMGVYGVTSRPTAGPQQEQHNVLLLSTCHSRFSLLPLSTQQSRLPPPQPVISQTLYRGVESGSSLVETAAAVIPQHSQTKVGTSSSFYDKLGTGLGSMTEISSWFSSKGLVEPATMFILTLEEPIIIIEKKKNHNTCFE
ncbi:COG1-like protein, partial [Mya arenaria]